MHGCTNVASAGGARATFHGMMAVLFQWESLFFRGVVVVAAFFGYFILAAEKK